MRHWRSKEIAILLLFAGILLLADRWCYQQTLPVALTIQQGHTTLSVGSERLDLGNTGAPRALQFAPHDPLVHEYQIDGSDSTNNFSLDTAYLTHIQNSPYYRLQNWMRDLDGTSRWTNVRVFADQQLLNSIDWPANGSSIALPVSSTITIQLQLQRPETPMSLNLQMANHTTLQVTIDRNNRKIAVTQGTLGLTTDLTGSFFPLDAGPFAAMILDTLLRTMLCAILVALTVLLAEIALIGFRTFFPSRSSHSQSGDTQGPASHKGTSPSTTARHEKLKKSVYLYALHAWRRLTMALHPIALLTLAGSFCFVLWIACVQYQGEPHIYDASAYLFAAKIYASGHLSVPLPPAADRFPGPFILQHDGQWFAQYAPGTGLTLAPGIWIGMPWLIEPLLGTLALLGIGLIAARLYDRRVASLAVVLGAFSPFYSYLAASYLSHAIALFYLVWGFWALLRFAQGKAGWNMLLSACCFGMAGLTRDLVAILYTGLLLVGVLVLYWSALRKNWRRGLTYGALFILILIVFAGLSLGFNALLTHNPFETPRALFYPPDHWGFGPGVGFYGQHTLAAGLVNLDELLTILMIDLYGWPFYLNLCFIMLPFLLRRATLTDGILLICAIIVTAAYIGYFYHGIYLGPRYLFETLPFLLILTARGILVLADWTTTQGKRQHTLQAGTTGKRMYINIPVTLLVTLLLCCNVFYFLPRQIELHTNYSGLPNWYHINLAEIYHPPTHNAIVVTGNLAIYQFVLFPLNDPFMRGDTLYAMANNDADYAELRTAYPGKTLYRLDIDANGNAQYVQLPMP